MSTIITGYELLELTSLSTTHSVVDRFKMFHKIVESNSDIDEYKFLFYCLTTGNVFYW